MKMRKKNVSKRIVKLWLELESKDRKLEIQSTTTHSETHKLNIKNHISQPKMKYCITKKKKSPLDLQENYRKWKPKTRRNYKFEIKPIISQIYTSRKIRWVQPLVLPDQCKILRLIRQTPNFAKPYSEREEFRKQLTFKNWDLL